MALTCDVDGGLPWVSCEGLNLVGRHEAAQHTQLALSHMEAHPSPPVHLLQQFVTSSCAGVHRLSDPIPGVCCRLNAISCWSRHDRNLKGSCMQQERQPHQSAELTDECRPYQVHGLPPAKSFLFQLRTQISGRACDASVCWSKVMEPLGQHGPVPLQAEPMEQHSLKASLSG